MAETSNGHNGDQIALNFSKPSSPQLKIEPASDWADNTLSALDSTDQVLASTSPIIPGSYPYSPSLQQPGPTFEEIKDTARQYIYAAGQYVPSHEDVRKIAHDARHTVRGYIPNGVSTRFGSMNPTQEAIPTSPIEESETTPSSGGGFVLINRGNRIAKDEVQNVSEPPLTPINKPAQVSGATRSKLLILEPKLGKNDSNSVQTDQASENASLKVLPGSKAESIRHHDSVPTPYSYTAKSGTSRSSSNSGVPVNNGHVDPRTLESLDNNQGAQTQGVINHGDYDVVLGPSGEGSVSAPTAGIASGTGPGPGITGPTMLGAGKEARTDFRSDDGILSTIQDEGSEEEPGQVRTNVTEKIVGKTESSESKLKDAEKEIENRKEEVLNVKQERGLEDAGVKDDEQSKPQVEKITVGGKFDEETLTKARKQSLEKETPRGTEYLSPQISPNAPVEKVGSSTATAENERAANTSKSTEQKATSTNGNPRPQSPMTSADNPHVSRAMSGPNAKKLADPSPTNGTSDVQPSKEQQRSGRKKSSFVQRLKTWSKKLSQNKKGQN